MSTTRTAQSWPTDPARTAELFTTVQAVADLIREHDLPPIRAMEIHASQPLAQRWNPETRLWDLPVNPKATITMVGSRVFAEWARAVGINEVSLRRRRGCDTTMNAVGDRGGVTFSLWGSYGLTLGPRDDVEWERNAHGRLTGRGTMTVDAVAALPEVDWVAAPRASTGEVTS